MGVHSPTDSFDSSYSSPVSEADDESHPFLSHELHDAIKLDDRQAEDGCCTSNARGTKSTPIPKAQLSVLCAVRLVDPIMFTQIFPYVNEMMASLHLTDDPSKIGLYSGMVVSTFHDRICSSSMLTSTRVPPGKQFRYLAATLHLSLGATIG